MCLAIPAGVLEKPDFAMIRRHHLLKANLQSWFIIRMCGYVGAVGPMWSKLRFVITPTCKSAEEVEQAPPCMPSSNFYNRKKNEGLVLATLSQTYHLSHNVFIKGCTVTSSFFLFGLQTFYSAYSDNFQWYSHFSQHPTDNPRHFN